MTDEKEEMKIIDRRRFDSEGKERLVEGDSDNSDKDTTAPKVKPADSKIDRNSNGQTPPEFDFSSFVMSFATQALMQLGEIEPPKGVSIPKDVNAAKQTIDILNMLQTKTKGNLDPREASLIEDILHNLRITYIKVSSSKA